MKRHNINVDEIYATFNDIFTEYAREVDKTTNETIERVADDGRKFIKYLTSSRVMGTRKYQNCFRTQKIDYGRRIKNTRYQLSHLLEDGHISANQYGRGYTIHTSNYGTEGSKRTMDFKMWEDTETMLEEYFPDELRKELNKIK